MFLLLEPYPSCPDRLFNYHFVRDLYKITKYDFIKTFHTEILHMFVIFFKL